MTVRGCAFQALHKHGVGGAIAGCLGLHSWPGEKRTTGAEIIPQTSPVYQNLNMDFQAMNTMDYVILESFEIKIG